MLFLPLRSFHVRTKTMFKNSKGGVKAPVKGNSAKVHSAAGSGSRPVTSKVGIMTSAPEHPHKLSRAPAGHLK